MQRSLRFADFIVPTMTGLKFHAPFPIRTGSVPLPVAPFKRAQAASLDRLLCWRSYCVRGCGRSHFYSRTFEVTFNF
jgi:hypothetical protein